MSFDGVFLHNLLKEFDIIKRGRISKIVESGDTDFIFTIRANRQNYNLMISLSSDFARIHFTTKTYNAPSNPKSLTMFLRKHIEGYFIEDIYQYGNDRIVCFKLAGYNEMRDFTTKYLLCEIMGRYSNLILADENYKILEVLKRDGVTEYGRTMLPNAFYSFPENEKLNPFSLSIDQINELKVTSPKDLLNKFEGVSMFLAEYTFKTEQIAKNFYDAIRMEIIPCTFKNQKDKLDFYFNPLDLNPKATYNSLSDLLDNFYFEADNQAKIKLKTNDLLSFVQKQILKNQKKIKKLELDIVDSLHAEEYKIKGELLLTYPNLKDKENKVEVYDYYNDENIVINLDAKYDIITNSQKFYKKYQKAKSAIHYINEQISHAQNEITYFEELSYQLKHCGINDALEIRQELIDNKYLINQTSKNNKKNKPNYLVYLVDNIQISVGKNNIQNEYITHKLAKANEHWFHVKDASGSHVVVHCQSLTENLIRTAAMIAAYYSSLGSSSSVPVDYTEIKNIKKIPGKRNCFVTYSKQKTIYIDPNEEFIESLRIKK